jgi:hypothetical protein
VKELLKRDADVDKTDNGGSTPLIIACGASTKEDQAFTVVKVLVDAKSDVNAKDIVDKASRMLPPPCGCRFIDYQLLFYSTGGCIWLWFSKYCRIFVGRQST